VAACDLRGGIQDPKGLDVVALTALKGDGKSVADCGVGQPLERDAIIDVECEIWIPAARPDVIDEDNVNRLKTKLIVSGANIPMTAAAERILHERNVLCVPDFIANAGGVICAAMEYHGSTQSSAFDAIAERIRANTEEVLQTSKQRGTLPRQAAADISVQRVKAAMGFRRWSIF